MQRLTKTQYRWLRRIGTLLGVVGGFVVDLRYLAAQDAAFARAGAHRVDYFPADMLIFLPLGALVGWTAVILVAHLLDIVPQDVAQTRGEADAAQR